MIAKKLTKRDLYPMILSRTRMIAGRENVKLNTAMLLIKEKTGGYVSRDLLAGMMTSKTRLSQKSAEAIAGFLGINVDKIDFDDKGVRCKSGKEKASPWEFHPEAQRAVESSRLFFKLLFEAGSVANANL